MEPGQQIERVKFSTFMGWVFRSKVRSLAVHENGLVLERGTGLTFIQWNEIQSIIVGAAELVSKTVGEGGTPTHSHSFFELQYAGSQRVKLSASAAAALSRTSVTDRVVDKANLEWVQPEVSGRQLPPMAVKPEVAADLRASFQPANNS